MDAERDHEMADLQGREHGVVGNWWRAMMKTTRQNKTADPNYYATSPETLESEAEISAFMVGNGNDIYSHMCPAIENAREEVVLVTCFWARSPSLERLSASLRRLSDRVMANREQKVRVFVGFSSISLFQKLFHTTSPSGTLYPSSTWAKKFHLPPASEIPGLNLQIKSIFVLPFSVMHPKFVLIDRKIAFLPSCNVSWEEWFEGCITLSGPIVHQFVMFWQTYWLRSETEAELDNGPTVTNTAATTQLHHITNPSPDHGAAYERLALDSPTHCYSLFLPSPHHRNPSFTFPWQESRPPPPTPLNLFTLELLRSATSTVYIQTPNLTSPPVLRAILRALRRGVDIHILTSEHLMILEQLVTAGTTTARCVRKLVKLYQRSRSSPRWSDEEMGEVPVGRLRIEYYQPRPTRARGDGEPVQSHLKLMIVDSEWVVLGSGNMDRASWYTSQELGVAFFSARSAGEVKGVVERQMERRTKVAFDSAWS